MTATGDFVDKLIARNASYAKNHVPITSTVDLKALPRVCVVTCADPRLFPREFLGLESAEVILLRNVGGRVDEYIAQEIVGFDTLLGNNLEKLVIIHHTDCSSAHYTTETIKQGIRARLPDADLSSFRTGSYEGQDEVESVKTEVSFVKSHPLIRDEIKANTFGMIYDIKSGLLTKIGV